MPALEERTVRFLKRWGTLVELGLTAGALPPEPGQFYQIGVGDGIDHWLARPMSYFRLGEDGQSFLFRVVGKGTAWLAARRPGDVLRVQGPLGRGFPLTHPGPHVLVGGGAGVPPLWDLARRLQGQGEVQILIGGRSADDVAVAQHFRGLGTVQVVTEDGSRGFRGLVSQHLPQHGTLYACGPTPMLAAVARHAEQHALPAFLSLEAHMACGFGVCLGCTVERRRPEGEADPYRRYLRVCVEGPVVAAEEVLL
jgi:dihydroorotate dehydrogenase electron transfer subunit